MAGSATPILGEAMQLAYVVRDLDAMLRFWTETMRVGPFLELTDVPPVEGYYHGVPTRPHLRMAWSFVGTTQVSVLQQLNDAPSPHLDFIKSGRQGIEHVGYWPKDAEAARRHLEGQGLKRCYEVRTGGGVVYYDPPPGMDTRISVIEASAGREKIYALLKRLVGDWDGQRPVRRYPKMSDFLAEHGIDGGW
jgi:hypothetical protein